MSLQIHVHGEASVYVDVGLGAGLTKLGVSVDGIDINLDMGEEDVIVDTFGPAVPFDVQYFLEQATVNMELVLYDLGILETILSRTGIHTFGVMSAAGTLFKQQSHMLRLLIKSTPTNQGVTGSEPCWNFPFSYLRGNARQKVGTRRTIWTAEFRAIPGPVSQDSSDGVLLYNQVCT